jgi:DNA-directed RNA polymerase specialized sigma24 family protein
MSEVGAVGGGGPAGARSGGRAQSAGFESLLEPLLDIAYGIALRYTQNPADAEDLVQEAALLAFRGFGVQGFHRAPGRERTVYVVATAAQNLLLLVAQSDRLRAGLPVARLPGPQPVWSVCVLQR